MNRDADRHASRNSRSTAATRTAVRERASGHGSSSLAFVLAAAGLAASALILLWLGESEWPPFVLGVGGLLAGRVAGVPDRQLVVIALGLAVFAWPMSVFSESIPGVTDTLAHVAVGALLAWVLAGSVRLRWQGAGAAAVSARWFAIPALVLAIGAVWELGEWVGDALFGADLAVHPLGTLTDLAAGFAGAVVGLAVYRISTGSQRIDSPSGRDRSQAVTGAAPKPSPGQAARGAPAGRCPGSGADPAGLG